MRESHHMLRLAIFALASTSLVACSSSSDSSDPVDTSDVTPPVTAGSNNPDVTAPVVVSSNDSDANITSQGNTDTESGNEVAEIEQPQPLDDEVVSNNPDADNTATVEDASAETEAEIDANIDNATGEVEEATATETDNASAAEDDTDAGNEVADIEQSQPVDDEIVSNNPDADNTSTIEATGTEPETDTEAEVDANSDDATAEVEEPTATETDNAPATDDDTDAGNEVADIEQPQPVDDEIVSNNPDADNTSTVEDAGTETEAEIDANIDDATGEETDNASVTDTDTDTNTDAGNEVADTEQSQPLDDNEVVSNNPDADNTSTVEDAGTENEAEIDATSDDATATEATETDNASAADDDTDAGNEIANIGIPQPQADEVVPTLPDPFAAPIPGVSTADFFNSRLDTDTEEPVAGGPPTTPKNLRVDLVSNNWSEINWAPSNDDVDVVAYNIYRSDGVVYEVERDSTTFNGGAQAEIDKIFATTAFIDCNFTRFFDSVHNCSVNQPIPGETYSYQVTAIDDEGQESPRSNPISVTYHLDRGAPVPRYEDPFLDESGFAQRNDLSETRFFLDEFQVTFEDEFDGTEIDENKWTTGLVWGDTRIINGEQQYFVNPQEDPNFGYDPFTFTGDSLIIEAIPVPDELRDNLPPVCDEPDPTGLDRCEFLSGAISSHLANGNVNGGHKYGFIYGYVESRLKVSGTPGALSSNYLYHRFPGEGVNRHGPEIDIIEYLGENPFGAEDAFQTYHYQDPESGVIRSAPTMSYANPDGSLFSDDFHTYGVLWEPSLVIWYIDGVEIQRLTGPQVSRQPMNIVNYLVAGSAWAPTPADDPSLFPIQFEVDYIRVMQRDAYLSTSRTFDPEVHGEL